ncbi:MAG TPA: hypothetical protein GXX55_09375 [Firmicutes bacterium]|nr:hypothetical protein [Bacillota bacterium]
MPAILLFGVAAGLMALVLMSIQVELGRVVDETGDGAKGTGLSAGWLTRASWGFWVGYHAALAAVLAWLSYSCLLSGWFGCFRSVFAP